MIKATVYGVQDCNYSDCSTPLINYGKPKGSQLKLKIPNQKGMHGRMIYAKPVDF